MALIAMASVANGVRWTDGSTVQTALSMAELLAQAKEPTAFVCEPEFYDGLRDVRRHLEDWLGEGGHRLVPITPRIKELLERAGRSRIEGRGVARLFVLATVGTERLPSLSPDQNLWVLRDALEVAHVADVFLARVDVVLEAVRAVGSYCALDPDMRNALGFGDTYEFDVLLAAYRAASVARSRSQFEQLLGLNAAGHGALTRTIRSWYVERNTDTDGAFVRESALTWAEYRRALRRIFHRISDGRRSTAADEVSDAVTAQLPVPLSSAAA